MKFYEALNEQMNFEYESAYLYKSMAAYLEDEGYGGFAFWMNAQVAEEVGHGEKIRAFLHEKGIKPVYRELAKPADDFSSVLDVFQRSLAHEKIVTENIDKLVNLARESDDKAGEIFLQWFVMEQVEEEDSFSNIIQRLERIGDSKAGLYNFDGVMGQRRD